MTQNLYDPDPRNESSHDAEKTLRLVAELPPPAELIDHVHHRLAIEKASAPRRSFWSLWMPAQRLQFAGAAVLVVAVAGSTWGIYHRHPQAGASVPSAPRGVDAGSGGSFGTAGAERVPPTLNPIKVPPAPKKKPSASRAAKPSAKTLAVQSAESHAALPSNP